MMCGAGRGAGAGASAQPLSACVLCVTECAWSTYSNLWTGRKGVGPPLARLRRYPRLIRTYSTRQNDPCTRSRDARPGVSSLLAVSCYLLPCTRNRRAALVCGCARCCMSCGSHVRRGSYTGEGCATPCAEAATGGGLDPSFAKELCERHRHLRCLREIEFWHFWLR